jgi:hypothetical protein
VMFLLDSWAKLLVVPVRLGLCGKAPGTGREGGWILQAGAGIAYDAL